MADQNFPDNILYEMDNLAVLRGMNSATVDLIATDPPFNTKRNRAGTAGFYVDNWRWGDAGILPDQWRWNEVHPVWLEQIRDENQALFEVIETTAHSHGDDIAAFLCFLSVRLLECRRLLKPTGSIYLHCDPAANGYIRMAMDAIFGAKNFRNEVVWKRSQGAKNAAGRYHSEHDTIFYYVKSPKFTWNPVYVPLAQDVIDEWYRYVDENGERYNVGDLQAPGSGGYEYEFLGATRKWRHPESKMLELLEQGQIVHKSTVATSNREVAGIKRYLSESKGALVGDIWQDIKLLGRRSREATGSPDQKPLALYERIILASSNEGDLVLDPFAGCATTIIAARRHNRRWVGIDRRKDARYHIVCRMAAIPAAERAKLEQRPDLADWLNGQLAKYEAHFSTDAPVRTDAGETAAPALPGVYIADERSKLRHSEMHAILWQQFGSQCWACDFVAPWPEYLELDHVNPKSDGGSNHLDNRALLCRPCNGKKGNRKTLSALRRDNRKDGRLTGDDPVNLRQAAAWARNELVRLGA